MTPLRILFAVLLAAALATEARAAQRAFVASYGNDASAAAGCLLSAPCRTFAIAIGQVDAGGEIIALDAAGYGRVTINKSVTITTNPGYYAGISAGDLEDSAIMIDGADADVVLRGLNMNGVGARWGIKIQQVRSLTVENCVISGFEWTGIDTFTAGDLRIIDTTIRKNGQGIFIGGNTRATLHKVRLGWNAHAGMTVYGFPTGSPVVFVTDSEAFGGLNGFIAEQHDGGSAHLSISRSAATNNTYGIRGHGANAYVAVGSSMIVRNSVGFSNEGGTFETYGNNILRHNPGLQGPITTIPGQ